MNRTVLRVIGMLFFLLGYCSIQAQEPPRLQAFHAFSDPQLETIDIYIALAILPGFAVDTIPDLPFRAATPNIEVPPELAGINALARVAPGNSTSIADAVFDIPVSLVSGKVFIAAGAGVIDPMQFAPNPDGLETNLQAIINDGGRYVSSESGMAQLFVIHAVTDAPTIDINIRGGTEKLADDLAFGQFSEYKSLSPASYILDMTDASGSTVIASFAADLSAFADSALTIVASGFMDPSNNQDGPPFALFLYTAGGAIIPLSPPTAIGDEPTPLAISDFRLDQNYPNPFNPSTTIAFTLPTAQQVTIKVANILGQEVATLVNERYNAGRHEITFDARELPSGLYFYTIQAGVFQDTKKMMLMK